MTKVKTILKEFCSAKDILAINRLGLLSKDEERESQPVPWRHRLKRKERRELVRSEMRMSLRNTGRVSSRDKVKAVGEARAPQHSRMGEHLIHLNSKAGGGKTEEMGRLSSEQRRTEQQLHQVKRNFLRQSQCLNREPLILVERPASPKVKSRAKVIEKHGVDPDVIKMPSYMRPLRSRSRTPSTLTTIEAFTLQTRKKKNVWEEAMEDKEDLKFKSTARPSARLTPHEVSQLKMGYSLHKPTTESIAEPKTRPTKSTRPKTYPRPKSTPGDLRSSSPVFITELPSNPVLDGKASIVSRSVSFTDAYNDNEKPKAHSFPFAKSHPHLRAKAQSTVRKGGGHFRSKSPESYSRDGSISPGGRAMGKQKSSPNKTGRCFKDSSSYSRSGKSTSETSTTVGGGSSGVEKKKDFLAVILDE